MSKADHLLLYLRYNIYLLCLLSCYVIGFCWFTYFTLLRSISIKLLFLLVMNSQLNKQFLTVGFETYSLL